MGCDLVALTVDTREPVGLARFWGGIFGWEPLEGPAGGGSAGEVVLVPTDDTGFRIRFVESQEPKTTQNQMHFDLKTATVEEEEQTRERALATGARHIDVGQDPEDDGVFADPEGNEFCVVSPGNNFLAPCGFLGCLSSDGSQAVGYFWSEALGWPLVWDQDEETAIRSPHGGPKISWGGPPVNPKVGKNRLHLDLAPSADSDLQTEVDRLLALGATHLDIGQGDVDWVVMADPDGNELCLHPR